MPLRRFWRMLTDFPDFRRVGGLGRPGTAIIVEGDVISG